MAGLLENEKRDFSADFQQMIPESIALANEAGLDDAILLLLGLEKKCRVHNDFHTLKEVCLHMIRMCRERNDWSTLNSTLQILSKRRNQSKMTVSALVEEATKYIDEAPSAGQRMDLIKALMSICEGKIYVEGESARLHLMLARMQEADGNIDLACQTIQDVHVETYGSISKLEKAEYILHQMRLNILNRDFTRTMIHSRKMNRKTIEETDFQSAKLQFYQLMVEYYMQEKNCWEICQCYYKMFSTPILEGTAAESEYLHLCITYLILSAHTNHTHDMLHRLLGSPALSASPFKNIVTLFTTHEIIAYPFASMDTVHAVLVASQTPLIATNTATTEANVLHFQALLHGRVNEHNIRVVSRYYSHISFSRMCSLLQLPADVLENHLSEMSSGGDVYVKIDRPAGVVNFRSPRGADAVLSDWASDVGKMLSLMESTCHLINRENMVNKTKA